MKRFFVALLIFLSLPVCAYGADSYNDNLSSFDLSCFQEELDKDTYSMLEALGIDSFDYSNISAINIKDIFALIKSIATNRIDTPLKSALIILAYVVLSSFFQSFKIGDNDSLSDVYSTASALIISTVLLVKIGSTIAISASAINVASRFIFAFIPAFCVIVVACGGATTAFSTNTLLLTLAQGLSFISSNVFVPIINCFLSISICSSLNAQLRLDRLVTNLRKLITTSISFLSACFVSVLSIKTAVASKTDAIGLRSIRFAINSVVPVIGSAISEGLLSIQTYSSLIKSSVGIVGIIAVSLVFLPSIIEVVIWRMMLSLCELVSNVFDDNSVSMVLKAFKDTMLLINVVLILSMVTTIISFGILIAARTG